MTQFFEFCVANAVLPATVLMVLIMLYGVMVLVGAADITLFDIDFDTDFDMDGASTSIGFVALKFLNIGQVPVMIWITVFGMFWWAGSLLLWAFYDQAHDPAGGWAVGQLVLRNAILAIVGTKCATEPMRKFFDHQDHYKPSDLVGQPCEVTTFEVNTETGQAKFATDAAPLLIDVRTHSGVLAKGDIARITDFDPSTNLYYIESMDPGVNS